MSIHEQEFVVHTYESDPSGFVTLGALCDYLLDSASTHATPLGFGFDEMREREYAWVLSRFLVRITRYPRWRETLIVRTWPSGTERLFALRDFIVVDSGGGELARATTSWLVINAVTRAPERIERVKLPADAMRAERALDVSAPRLPTTDDWAERGAAASTGTVSELGEPAGDRFERVRYDDIDLNGHVTSACYIRWALESLDMELRRDHEVRELAVNFLAESRYGEQVVVRSRREVRPGDARDADSSVAAGAADGERSNGRIIYTHLIERPGSAGALCRLRSTWMPRAIT